MRRSEESQEEYWTRLKRVEKLLLAARKQLPKEFDDYRPRPLPGKSVLVGTLDEFFHFMEVDEYELAWDALSEVAKRANARPACLIYLGIAAMLLGEYEKALQVAERTVKVYPRDRS